MTVTYEFEHLHQPLGWLSPGYVTVDDSGVIDSVSAHMPAGGHVSESLKGFAIPGTPNLHSHAFQRALAGRTEYVSGSDGEDTFWTWRNFMYDFVSRLGPEDYRAIGAMVYLEMIRYGMTSVAEFHYVHHASDGSRFNNRAEMADQLIEAANQAGVGMTMLPVLYAHAGIGQKPAPQQARFTHPKVDEFLQLYETIRSRSDTDANLQAGIALHSLRAVAPDELRAAVTGALAIDPDCRLHIHVSEQPREVEEVLAGLGARPVQWLLDNVELDEKWTLVHATHLDEQELDGLARSRAVAGLCPVTEATLGDGLFELVEYQDKDGRWGIGTDSHYTTSIAEELRVLECGQRLRKGQRNVLANADRPLNRHTGRRLFDLALQGGAQAMGMRVGSLVPGFRADLVVLDANHPTLISHNVDTVLDAWILSGTGNPVRDVMTCGNWVLRDCVHRCEGSILDNYRATMEKLTE